MKKALKEQRDANIILDRQAGMSREALAQKYQLTLAGIKSILSRKNISLPMDQRQSNAYAAKLLKNPDAMTDMRKALTPDVVSRRNQTIKKRYAEDPALRALKGQQTKTWWAESGPESKYTWADVEAQNEKLGFRLIENLTGPINAETAKIACHCGLVWEPRIFDLLYGKITSCGCVKSKPQSEIALFIQSLGLDVSTNVRTIIGPYELDIVVESQKIAIEYYGLAWHGEYKNVARDYHLQKLERAEAMGYRLVTIFADEWLSNPVAVKGYLRAILRKGQSRRFGARECVFVKLPWEATSEFLDLWHIQGSGAPLKDTYGLMFDGEVLAVATFKPTNLRRRGRSEDGVWELVRYCVKGTVSIAGGFSKLLKHFKDIHHPKVIFSYSDRRWSQGSLYSRAGFTLVSTLRPSYWYFKKNTDFPRYHKSKFRKTTIGATANQTEWEVMQSLGYDRIWDCGIQKWALAV